jgi:hypothetical protein
VPPTHGILVDIAPQELDVTRSWYQNPFNVWKSTGEGPHDRSQISPAQIPWLRGAPPPLAQKLTPASCGESRHCTPKRDRSQISANEQAPLHVNGVKSSLRSVPGCPATSGLLAAYTGRSGCSPYLRPRAFPRPRDHRRVRDMSWSRMRSGIDTRNPGKPHRSAHDPRPAGWDDHGRARLPPRPRIPLRRSIHGFLPPHRRSPSVT